MYLLMSYNYCRKLKAQQKKNVVKTIMNFCKLERERLAVKKNQIFNNFFIKIKFYQLIS